MVRRLRRRRDVGAFPSEAFRSAMVAGKFEEAGSVAATMGSAALRDTLASLSSSELVSIRQAVGARGLAELLRRLESHDAADVLGRLDPIGAAEVLDEFAPDDAADAIGALQNETPELAQEIVAEMERAEEVGALLVHHPDTAGGRMTTDFLAIHPDRTVEDAIRVLREHAVNGEFRGYLYVVDDGARLLGVVQVHSLVLAEPAAKVMSVMVGDPLSVAVSDDQEDVAALFRERRLFSVPVVDKSDRLVGIITADDAAEVAAEEATEDITRLGGSEPLAEPYLRSSSMTLVRKRVRWLLILFVAEAYSGTVLRHFEDVLQQAVALAFFIPLLIDTGGNSGTQITATLTWAMALGEVTGRDVWRVWRKEVKAGVVLAVVMASATFIRGWMLDVGMSIQIVVAASAGLIMVWSSVIASILPLVLRRFRLDPAVVSGPLITTLVDGTGLIIYFQIARVVMGL